MSESEAADLIRGRTLLIGQRGQTGDDIGWFYGNMPFLMVCKTTEEDLTAVAQKAEKFDFLLVHIAKIALGSQVVEERVLRQALRLLELNSRIVFMRSINEFLPNERILAELRNKGAVEINRHEYATEGPLRLAELATRFPPQPSR